MFTGTGHEQAADSRLYLYLPIFSNFFLCLLQKKLNFLDFIL